MADIVVKDLGGLVDDLNALIEQFNSATKFQDEFKGHWGQHNANLSMGDFAHNWRINRKKMVESMEKFRDVVKSAEENWAEGERQLAASLEEKP
jgi:hypothetical protein